MIKLILSLSLALISLDCLAQIDYSKLIIGRNTGTKTLHDGNVTKIFGFTETLNEVTDTPGPTIRVTEGDTVQIDFWNVSQGAPHTIHLHGLDVNQENDGVPHLSFAVNHMDHGYYQFKAPHPGTYIYHCHVVSTIHVQAGMYGVIIVEPSNGSTNTTWVGGETFDRDILLTASEIDTNWHTEAVLDHEHDPANPIPVFVPEDYIPQYFLVNGLSETQLVDPLNHYTTGANEHIFMRLVNIGYYGVRYIFPGSMNARTISSDGRPLPQDFVNDTIEVLPGERYGTLIQTGTEAFYNVDVEYFNMNTQVVASSQQVTLRTSLASINKLELNLVIYPNPSENGLFHAVNAFTADYTVYAVDGEMVLKSSEQLIDLSKQKPGMYIIRYQGSAVKLCVQ